MFRGGEREESYAVSSKVIYYRTMLFQPKWKPEPERIEEPHIIIGLASSIAK
jgi:hypothetical protein